MSIISENIEVARIHLKRIKEAGREITEKNLLTKLNTEDFETVKTIDTFVFRFIKLQDYMGQKLFKRFLDAIGEFYENMSFIDMLDKLEQLDIITSADEWMKIRKLRNKITHDYPDELKEIENDLKIAMNYVDEIENSIIMIERYLKQRNLI